MLGRCQQTLVKGLVAGLQQHQQCLQLEVLGTLQSIRHVNDWKAATRATTSQRGRRRRDVAVEKALERINPLPSVASLIDESLTLPSSTSSTSSAAPSAADAATPSSSSNSTVSGPLSDAIPDASTSTSSMVSSAPASKDNSWAPDWLNKLMDMPFKKKKKPRPAPVTASPLQQDAPQAVDSSTTSSTTSSSSKETAEDDWPELDKFKDMSLDDYQRMLQDEPGAEEMHAQPRPKKPKGLNNPRAMLRDRIDYDRLAHARYSLHYNLISTMSATDKDVARHNATACMKDLDWLKRVAQVGQTRPDVVVDMLRNYQRRREAHERLAAWRDSGRKMPNKDDMGSVDKILTIVKEEKERDDLKPILEKRDPASCELHLWRSAWARGPKKNQVFRLCPRTELPYGECCGALRRRQ